MLKIINENYLIETIYFKIKHLKSNFFSSGKSLVYNIILLLLRVIRLKLHKVILIIPITL